MKMTCPHCGVAGSAPGSQAGEKVRCSQCEKVYLVTERKVACPHCAVIGAVGDSAEGAKLRCPLCEKVFLLTHELLAGRRPVENVAEPAVALAATEMAIALDAADESDGAASLVGEADSTLEAFTVQEPEELAWPEPFEEELGGPQLEEEVAELTTPDDTDLVTETKDQPPVHEPDVESVQAADTQPPLDSVELPQAVPEASDAQAPDASMDEPLPEGEKPEETTTQDTTESAATTVVCVGCGESFDSKFLCEISSQPFCADCQLRLAAAEEKAMEPARGGRLRGALAAIILLGLLSGVLLVLMKMGVL